MNTKLLTIIIPVYNVEDYLPKCLNSVINYDLELIEIILVNDGSTDDSLMICRQFADRYSNIKIITQTNQGLSEARNTGIRHSSGKFLMFLDSDDYLIENSLLRILNDLQKYDADIFLGRSFQFDNNEDNKLTLKQVDYDKINYTSPIDCLYKLNRINHFWFAAWLLIAKREFIISNSLFFMKGILHEDELWIPTVFIKANNIKLLNYGFYCYRTNRMGSIVSKPNIKREFDKFLIIEEFNRLKKIYIDSERLLSARQSSLLFGILLSINIFQGNSRYNDLKYKLNSSITILKNSKYFIFYYLCRIFGVNTTSRLLSYIVK